MIPIEDLIIKDIEDITLENYQKVISKFVQINDLAVRDELIRQPYLYAHYSGLKSECKKYYDLIVSQTESHCAEKRVEKKEQNPKITEKGLDAYIQIDPITKSYNTQIIELENKVNLMKGIEDALRQRKDILIQLSANIRQEMKSL